MTTNGMRSLRLKLRDELWRFFPKADVHTIWRATDRLLPLLLRETFRIVENDHEDDCACWNCVLALNADVTMTVAMLRVKYAATPDESVPNAEK